MASRLASFLPACLLVVVATLVSLDRGFCCVYKFGEDPTHPLSKPGALHFTYEFAGLDWKGLCATGEQQSPINIPHSKAFDRVPAAARTIPDFGMVTSNGSNVKVFNNEHVVQVEWAAADLSPNASVAVADLDKGVLTDTLMQGDKAKRATITPIQFHFHGHSEHSLGGAFWPLELHIVSQATKEDLGGCTGPLGCLTVVGIMFGLADDDADSPLLTDIFDAMPARSGNASYLATGKILDLNALMPSNKSYVTYSGSLTTPPCSESVLWHVMLEPMTLSTRQLNQFLNATGDLKCSDGHESSGATKPAADTAVTEKAAPVCTKLGAGQNYRMVQSTLGRSVKAYIEEPAANGSAGSGKASSGAAPTAAPLSTWLLLTSCVWLAVVTSMLLGGMPQA